VKDKTRIGMTLEFRNAWTMKTPHRENYMDYLDLLQQTGHQLEDVLSFNRTITRDNHSSHNDKSDERDSTSKNQRKKEKVSGNHNLKPFAAPNKPPRQKTSE